MTTMPSTPVSTPCSNFCVVDLSGFYLDVQKDCLYTNATDDPARRAAQTVLFEILMTMTTLMAPILSFTAEEIWDYIPGAKDIAPSVHMAPLPKADDSLLDADLAGHWDKLIAIRGEVNRALDIARKDKVVGNSLEARLQLAAEGELAGFIRDNAAKLQEITMVSQFEVAGSLDDKAFASEEIEGLKVGISPSGHEKCAAAGPGWPAWARIRICRICVNVARRWWKSLICRARNSSLC